MTTRTSRFAAALILSFLWQVMPAAADHSAGAATIGTTFPADFPVIKNYTWGAGNRFRRAARAPLALELALARSGNFPPWQQRHAVSHCLQSIRQHARHGAILSRQRLCGE